MVSNIDRKYFASTNVPLENQRLYERNHKVEKRSSKCNYEWDYLLPPVRLLPNYLSVASTQLRRRSKRMDIGSNGGGTLPASQQV